MSIFWLCEEFNNWIGAIEHTNSTTICVEDPPSNSTRILWKAVQRIQQLLAWRNYQEVIYSLFILWTSYELEFEFELRVQAGEDEAAVELVSSCVAKVILIQDNNSITGLVLLSIV